MQDDSAGDDVSRLTNKNKEQLRGRPLGLALMLTTALAAISTLSSLALAQSPAFIAVRTNFNIPAQPLAQALVQFSNATGIQLFFNADVTRGINSAGAQGSLTRTEALGRILAGSGLNYKFTNASTVTIQRPNGTTSAAATVPGAISLDTINVQGDQQSPYGPGVGYTATRSVAGTKSDTPIIETPQSISVVTRQQIDDQQAQDINQALRYTPGIVAEEFGVASDANAANNTLLRGFTPNSFLDGLKFGFNSLDLIDPYLLDRIEVLSGPASVLYGQASPGGLIDLDSKLPTTTPLHQITLGFGSYGLARGGFDLGGPLDKDGQFSYRITGVGLTQDTQTDYTKRQTIAIAPALTWRPDNDTTLTILGKYINNPAVGAYATLPAYGTVLPNPNGMIPTRFFAGDPSYNEGTNTVASIGYKFEHRFDDDWTVRQNFRYTHSEMGELQLWPTGFEPDLATLDRYSIDQNQTIDSVRVDNQVQKKLQTGPFAHTLLAGIDYQHDVYRDVYGFDFSDIPSINVFAPTYNATIPPISNAEKNHLVQTQDQIGVYAQDQISLGRWRFMIGGREDWASSTNDYAAPGAPTSTNTGQFNRAFTWRTGVLYLFDNGVAPYVSYSTSFQPQVGATFSGTPYVPTTGQQYEAGVKYQPPGSNSFVTAAIYNLTEQNVLTTDTDPTHAGFEVQTGEIRSRGVELQAHASITDNLTAIATYTFTDAINTQTNTTDTTIDGITESTLGKHPVAIPEQMASLWADYTFHQGTLNGFGFSGGARYVGPSYGDDVNSFKVPGVTLFDAALHYDLGAANPSLKGFKLQINASNLFDKIYVASCTYAAAGCSYGLRRTVLGTLTYTW